MASTLDHLIAQLLRGATLDPAARARLAAAMPPRADLERESPLVATAELDERLDAALLWEESGREHAPCVPLPAGDAAAILARVTAALPARSRPRQAVLARARAALASLGRWPYAAAAVATAAALALGFALWPLMRQVMDAPAPGAEVGLKGVVSGEVAPDVAMMFAVGAREGEQVVMLGRGAPQGTYRQEQLLILRYRLAQPAHLCLLHQGPAATTILLQTTAALEPGEYLLGEGRELSAVPLAGQPGTHRFTLYAAGRPLACPPEDLGGVASDSFSIQVAP